MPLKIFIIPKKIIYKWKSFSKIWMLLGLVTVVIKCSVTFNLICLEHRCETKTSINSKSWKVENGYSWKPQIHVSLICLQLSQKILSTYHVNIYVILRTSTFISLNL